GVVDADALAAVPGLGEDGVDLLGVADQEGVDVRRLERECGRPPDHLGRSVVASHDVEGDGGGAGTHGTGEPVILVESGPADRARSSEGLLQPLSRPSYFAAGVLASETFWLAVFRSMQPLVSVYWYVPSSSRQNSPWNGQ